MSYTKEEILEIRRLNKEFLTELIVKLSNHFVLNFPMDSNEWPEMRTKIENLRSLINDLPNLTSGEKEIISKHLVGKNKRGRPKGSKNKPKNGGVMKQRTNKKSLLECALNKQGISLTDIEKDFNRSAKK